MSETTRAIARKKPEEFLAKYGSELKLNVACGDNKIEGYVGIDLHDSESVDILHDIRLSPIPFPDNSVEEIVFFHAIEHIEEGLHQLILNEFWRLLKPGKGLYISYPEFSIIAVNWLDNYKGQRDFWKKTIYGLQRHVGDYHVALMHTPDFIDLLKACGFRHIEHVPEPNETYNTVIYCVKGEKPQNYEDLIVKSCLTEPCD